MIPWQHLGTKFELFFPFGEYNYVGLYNYIYQRICIHRVWIIQLLYSIHSLIFICNDFLEHAYYLNISKRPAIPGQNKYFEFRILTRSQHYFVLIYLFVNKKQIWENQRKHKWQPNYKLTIFWFRMKMMIKEIQM